MSEDTTKTEKNVVSFSQFSNWYKCPHRWYLDYPKGLKKFEDNLNTAFGTAIHETLQLYLKTLYQKSSKKADKINMKKYFKFAFNRELRDKKLKYTDAEYTEFLIDAQDILDEFNKTSNKLKHFPVDKYELLDIEHELRVDIMNNVKVVAYMDIVLKNKLNGNIKIIDVKTSTSGWNMYQKEDYSKLSQLLIYKALYSKKYNIPFNKINIEFFILKRKLYKDVSYPQDRIQIFVPKNDGIEVKKSISYFSNFVSECFTPEGVYKPDIKHPKIPGKNKKNCKFCPHKKINCDGIADPVEDINE